VMALNSCTECGAEMRQSTSSIPTCRDCRKKKTSRPMDILIERFQIKHPGKLPHEVNDFAYWQQCLRGEV
jgi:hypothetical protein